MRLRHGLSIGIIAIAAFAAWPAFLQGRAGAQAAQPQTAWTPAPVQADYARRDAIVADYEADARRNPGDQIILQMLAGQYLQRYREKADVGDLLRAQSAVRTSLALQPRYNANADMQMASVLLAFHQMKPALGYAREAAAIVPSSTGARAMIASLDMEIGDYAAAKAELERRPATDDMAWDLALARYDELTGHLASARTLMDHVQRRTDEVVDNPAEARAWAHWRQGELAFTAGDLDDAIARYREALAIFPGYWHAYDGLAKAYWAQRRWHEALDAATKGADAYPLPEVLGYKYDAQRSLGDREGAAETLGLIETIERLGNVQGMDDRLIALFEADHGLHPDDAVAIARRDLQRRDDIYAEDTLAWALAADHRWNEARAHAERAVASGTEDARVQYHAGIIALACAQPAEARRRLAFALSVNPQFHPYQAQDARRQVHALGG